MKTLNATTLALLLAVPTATLAAEKYADDGADEQGVYVGASYGLVKIKDADDFDDDNGVLQLQLGGKLNKYIAIEGSLLDFGDFGEDDYETEVDGKTLALKGFLPLTDVIALYGKGGMLWWETDYDILGVKGDADGTEIFYGAGVEFSLTPNVNINLDYTRYSFEFSDDEIGLVANFDEVDADLDQTSIGINYLF